MTPRGGVGPVRHAGVHHQSSYAVARRQRAKTHVLVALVSTVVVVAPFYALVHSQAQVKSKAEATFQGGAPSAAGFVFAYLHKTAADQRSQAQTYLSDIVPDPAKFTELVTSFGFQNAILLDDHGTVLAVYPDNPSIMGQSVASFSPSMMTSRHVVSDLRAPTGTKNPNPVVELTTPYVTLVGAHRVLIGGYQVGNTPLGVFLNGAVPYPQRQVYLTDAQGYILASAPSLQSGSFLQLSHANSALAQAAASSSSGFCREADGNTYFYASANVPATTWRIVTAVPTSELFAGSVRGAGQVLQWFAFAVYLLVVAFAIRTFYKYLAGRDRLAALTMELDMVSRLDPLTGLYNRRHLDDSLGPTISLAQRHKHHLSLLMVDVDHFKRVNDTYGHESGDVVLVEVSRRMTDCLRPGDLLGRWGGEEFLVVLPITDSDAAADVAERLRVAICRTPVEISGGRHLEITASIGCATEIGEQVHGEALIRHADAALYHAKETGRNRVIVATARASHQHLDHH